MSHEDDGPLTPAPTIRDLGPPIDLVNADTEPPTDPAPDPVLVALVDVLAELGKVKDELRLSRANDELSRSALSNKVDVAIAEARAAHAASVVATDAVNVAARWLDEQHKQDIAELDRRLDKRATDDRGAVRELAKMSADEVTATVRVLEGHMAETLATAHVDTGGNGNGHHNGDRETMAAED
jgi:hypothetical protein